MKESEAWRILAEEHDARKTRSGFLCCALDAANERLSTIPSKIRSTMSERIKTALDGRVTAYGWDTPISNFTEEARQARVLACLMFSEQAKDEERK